MTGPGKNAGAGGEQARRTVEIEDFTNLYFIHPVSARLVPVFARAGITPNMVSLFGMACGVFAGACYFFYRNTGCAIAGFVLMLAWHVMDGADGQLARLTRSYSDFGKVLDGICDYVTFAAVYAGLGLALVPVFGGWVCAVILFSGICHAVQSAAYEVQRQSYDFWGKGRQSAAPPSLAAPAAAPPVPARGAMRRVAVELNRIYARVQLWAAGNDSFGARFAAIMAAHPGREAMLRAEYRAHFAPLVRRWGILSANYRTLGIFIAALLRLPLLYFLFEIAGFSLILLVLLRAQKTANAEFLRQIGQAERRREPLMPAIQQPSA